LMSTGIGYDGRWAKLQCSFHGHGRVNAKFSGLVTAGRHNATLYGTHEHGLSFQRRVVDEFDRYKEGVKIKMGNIGLRRRQVQLK
jgi:hypothetical protein